MIAALGLTGASTFADVPEYQGKVILVTEKTLYNNTTVATKLGRLKADLVADGWRVIEHQVAGGPVPSDANWEAANMPLVRQVKSLIQADYNAAPGEIKSVFVVGHVPVPYSGDSVGVVGGHSDVCGAHPADWFYADPVSPYGPTGWTDYTINNPEDPGHPADWAVTWWYAWNSVINMPADGKFDQDAYCVTPALSMGRLDLTNLPGFLPKVQTDLLSGYLDKDHDYRNANFRVQRRAFHAACAGGPFVQWSDSVLQNAFGAGNVSAQNNDNTMHWFPNLSGNGQDYLLAYGGGWGNPESAAYIGATGPGNDGAGIESTANNFVTVNSKAVFVSLYGSYFGDWDFGNDILKAVLANPYDPANGKNGYGLCAYWGGNVLFSDANVLASVNHGGTIGEAMRLNTVQPLHISLLGDPTLRFDVVTPVSSLTATGSSSQVTLGWNASTGASSYYIYSGPTMSGPFTRVASVSSLSWTLNPRPTNGTPDNFYMVRAMKRETVPDGFGYNNLSAGVVVAAPGTPKATLQIANQPANATVLFGRQDSGPKSAAFSVDAFGISTSGNDQLQYVWKKNGTALTESSHLHGTTGQSLMISDVTSADAGAYTVTITSGTAQVTSSAASLITKTVSTANPDTFNLQRNTTTDLTVLANDQQSPDSSGLSIKSISALSYPMTLSAGSFKNWMYFCAKLKQQSDGVSAWIVTSKLSQATAQLLASYQINTTVPQALQTALVQDLNAVLSGPPIYDATRFAGVAIQNSEEQMFINGTVVTPQGRGLLRLNRLLLEDAYPNDIVSFLSLVNAGALTISSDKSKLHLVPDQKFIGTYLFTYILGDGNGFIETNVTVNVSPKANNQPPTVSQLPSSATTSIDVTAALPFTLTDDFTLPNDVVITVRSSNPDLIPEAYVTVSGSGSSKVLNIMPGNHRIGTGTIWVTFTDEDGASTVSTLNVTVNPLPQPTLLARGLSGGVFHFSAVATAGQSVSVMASGDLQNWTLLETKTLPSSGSVDYYDTIGSITRRYYRASIGSSYSQIVGFTKVAFLKNVPSVIANPFRFSKDNFLSEIFPSFPVDVVFWNLKGGQWESNYFYTDGESWDDNTFKFEAGSGSLVTASADCSIVLMGDVVQGTQVNTIQPINTYCSSMVPKADSLDALGFVPANGTQIRMWDSSIQNWGYAITYNSGVWTKDGGTVVPSPILGVGECFLVSGSQSVTWTQSFTAAVANTFPSAGTCAFDANSRFNFNISSIPASSACTIYASADMSAWTQIGTRVGPGLFTDANSAASTRQFYRVQCGNCYSAPVGFSKLNVPANQSVFLANPFNHSPDNTVPQVLANTPRQSTFYEYGTDWMINNLYDDGTWDYPDMTLNPGVGGLFAHPAGTPLTFIFSGSVPQGHLETALPQNWSMPASQVPASGNINDLGFVAQNGDVVYKWNPPLGAYDSYAYQTARGWINSATGNPAVSPWFDYCEGFFLSCPQSHSWVQNSISACSPLPHVNGGAFDVNDQFTITISGVPANSVCIIYSSDDSATWTALAKVTVSGSSVTYTDQGSAAYARRFYRVNCGDAYSEIVGFTRLAVPANATVVIANPFNHSPNNKVSEMLGNIPVSGTLYKWVNNEWDTDCFYDDRTWDDPDLTLNPGEGATFVSSQAMTVKFFGYVSRGHKDNLLPAQMSYVSSMALRMGRPDEWGMQLVNGDQLYKWNPATQAYQTYTYSSAAPSHWNDASGNAADFTIGIAEPFWINKTASQSVSWGEDMNPVVP